MTLFTLPRLALLVAVFLGGFFFWLFQSAHQPFPSLGADDYIGWFPAKVLEQEEGRIFFRARALDTSGNFEIAILRSGWVPKTQQLKVTPKEAVPLHIPGPEGMLRFGGVSSSEQMASGTVVNTSNGNEASWYLYSVSPIMDPVRPQQQLDHLRAMRAEQLSLELEIASQQHELEAITQESSRLEGLIREGTTLMQRADTRFSEKQSEIEQLQSSITELEQEIVAKKAALEIAKSVTQRGRITTLARERVAREYQVINFKLAPHTREADADLLDRARQAKEALALRQKLVAQGGTVP